MPVAYFGATSDFEEERARPVEVSGDVTGTAAAGLDSSAACTAAGRTLGFDRTAARLRTVAAGFAGSDFSSTTGDAASCDADSGAGTAARGMVASCAEAVSRSCAGASGAAGGFTGVRERSPGTGARIAGRRVRVTSARSSTHQWRGFVRRRREV
jgi:hypothetical protein